MIHMPVTRIESIKALPNHIYIHSFLNRFENGPGAIDGPSAQQ
jgi:hypothetical protein